MLQIHLQNVIFFAHHGLFEEERILGNHYEVNIRIETSIKPKALLEIGDTIDYSKVHALLESYMKRPTALLENIAIPFCHQVLLDFPSAASIWCSIKKMNPPINGMRGDVAISYQLNRSEL